MTDVAVPRPRRTDPPGQVTEAGAAAAASPERDALPAPASPPASETVTPTDPPRSEATRAPAPTMHALWLEAGGGTDAYDVDRYVGLLREHGYAKKRKPLTAIVLDVHLRTIPDQGWTDDERRAMAADFARLLTDELGKHGYRIHDITRCVRPAGDPLTIGRPMTPDEEAALVIPAEARPRRRRS